MADIHVKFTNDDIHYILNEMINHPMKEEFLKLLVPLISESHKASEYFIKIHSGHKLYKPIEPGRICYVSIDALDFDANKKELKESRFNNGKDEILCRVIDHNGYHLYRNTQISYINVYPDGKESEKISQVEVKELTVVEDI